MKVRTPVHESGSFLVLELDALHMTLAHCQYVGGDCQILDYITHVSDVPLIHETTSVFTHAFRVAFDSATNRLHDKMGSSSLPEEIVCICSRQDFLAFPFSYTFSRPHSRSSITHEELDSYVAEAQKKAYDQAKNRWGQILLHDPRHMHLISSSIHTLEIDRKIVLHPIGHCGEQVRLSFLYVFCVQSFFDTVFRFFEKKGFMLSALIPRQIAELNVFYTEQDFFGDYLLMDFGYYTTSIITHHGGRLQDFCVLPIGAHTYDKLLELHHPHISSLDRRSQLRDLSRTAHSPAFSEYSSLILDGLRMTFPLIEARVSTKEIYACGNYGYQELLQHVVSGELSPHVQIDSSVYPLSRRIADADESVLAIQALFSSKTLFSVYRDPLVNIFRSTLFHHET